MKKTIITITLMIALFSISQITFAQDSVVVTSGNQNDELPVFKYATVDSAADFRRFKNYAEINVNNNKQIIDQLKMKKAKGDHEVKTKFKKQVSELEEKNEEMAMRIAIADLMATPDWPSFKRNFTKKMTELTTSIRNLSDTYSVNKEL